MNSTADRLKELRKLLGLSQTDFGKKIGKNYHSVMRWELGKVLPPDNVIEHICSMFKTNTDWLKNGTGTPFENSSDNLLHEGEETGYNADNYTVIPIYADISDRYKNNAKTCGQLSVSASEMPLSAVIAPADSAPPIMKDDIIVFAPDTENTDGKLCIVVGRYGEVSVRRHYKKENILASKRPEYPDIQASEAEIAGVVKEIIRKISL